MQKSNYIATLLEDNWDQIKPEIPVYWQKLTPAHMENITGYKKLVGKLKKIYEFSNEEITENIIHFLRKLDILSSSDQIKEFK